MKKLYLLLASVFCLAIAAKAEVTYNFKITVEDPENVQINRVDYDTYEVIEAYDVKEGLNEYTITVDVVERLLITASEGKILKVHNEDGSQNFDVKNNKLDIYLSSYSFSFTKTDYVLTVKTFDEATFRNRSVKVTLDKPEGIRMTLRGGSVINTDKTEYEIPFNDEYEDVLTIRAQNSEDLIYKITADGKEVAKEGLEYPIVLVDRSDEDNITYVENIVITQEFPEDMNYNVKIAFANGDAACVSSVTYGDQAIEDYAAADGFNVRPGKKLVITFNKADYKIESYSLNGGDEKQATYLSTISEVVASDMSYVITATKYAILNFSFVVADPATVKITKYDYPYPEVELVAGENKLTAKQDDQDNKFNVGARKGYELVKIYDKTYDKEIEISTYYSTTTVTAEANSVFEITSQKIVRDKKAVLYVDNVDGLTYGFNASRGDESIYTGLGYNLFDFRDKENKLSISASGASGVKAYRNGEEVAVSYAGYFSLASVVDNEVIKLFFKAENAVLHTVTFDMIEGTLDGFEVKKDILSDVDPSAAVSAVGKTQFTISPVSRDTEDLIVKIGEQTIEAVNGVYTFETEADTTVSVSKSTSGVEDVIYNEKGSNEVYNLQGIRVATDADLNNLPAGIYVVNGQKVAVK